MIKSCRAGSVSWISVGQMRDVERVAMELGLTETRLMENAGANLAWLASTMLGGAVSGRRITRDRARTAAPALSPPAA
jgi:hypothetical protein